MIDYSYEVDVFLDFFEQCKRTSRFFWEFLIMTLCSVRIVRQCNFELRIRLSKFYLFLRFHCKFRLLFAFQIADDFFFLFFLSHVS